jgi:hypothetical protein
VRRPCALAYTKFTRDAFRDLGVFWKRRDSHVNWERFEAGRDSQREFTRLHLRITVTMRYIFKYESRQMSRKPRIWVKFADSSLISLILTFFKKDSGIYLRIWRNLSQILKLINGR